MKTRIFTTAAMFILTTGLVEGTTHHSDKDSSAVLAFSSAEKHQTAPVHYNGTEFHTESNTFVLENWIADRESWEQAGTGMAAESLTEQVNLDEWVSEREAWEQESDTESDNVYESINMEEWIAGRVKWEQEGSGREMTAADNGSHNLVRWIADRENWEQK